MPRKWRKVLYEDQGVPDNYVDKTFLAQMRKNIYVREYLYWNVVTEACSIQHHLCCNILFAVCFAQMYWDNLAPWAVIYAILPCALAGYCLFLLLPSATHCSTYIGEDLRSATLFVLILLALTPVLRTLTESISTDTIFAMAAVFFCADLVFFNYTATDTAVVSKTLSLNAALFAAICLTSRLETNLHTFVTIALAMVMFGLRPPLFSRLKSIGYPFVQIALTLILSLATCAALAAVSYVAVLAFLGISTALLLLCPLILIRMQKLKNNIYGPWDEAMVRE